MYQEEGCLKAAGYVCGREGADGTCSWIPQARFLHLSVLLSVCAAYVHCMHEVGVRYFAIPPRVKCCGVQPSSWIQDLVRTRYWTSQRGRHA